MKRLFLTAIFLFAASAVMTAQDTIALDTGDSMCIAGKGPGQDGAINPYLGEDSIAVVENVGKNEFSIRIQKKGEIINTIKASPGWAVEVKLRKDHVMYFDSATKAMAKVDFKKWE